MTIKEFALLAGVSVSTVSKIMNGKDASISARTREHVLKLAKEYNYVPYASAAAPTTRTLTMGVTMTIGEYAVTGPLARYLNLHPDVNVCLRFSNTDRLLEAIRVGEMDLALSEGYIRSEEFDTELFRRERYIPVCAAGHALPAGKQKLKDLLGERLILREKGSGSRKILERNLAARNLKISDFIHYAEVENIHTMVSLLVRDCGIAFLYEAAVEQEIRQGLLKEIRLEDFSMDHEFLFLWNKGSVFSSELKKLCEEWIQLDKDASGGR